MPAPPPPATQADQPGTLTLLACPRCSLIQRVPAIPPTHRALCFRCRARLDHAASRMRRSLAWPAALALGALILYPAAMSLPVIELHRFGHLSEATILSGIGRMYAGGHVLIATIVLLCSVLAPLAKILGIFALCAPRTLPAVGARFHPRHQAATYRAIDWLGRWGMIDVLLVAILVAAVKLGDWATVHPGPGIVAFAGVVILSLLASFTFNPTSIWD